MASLVTRMHTAPDGSGFTFEFTFLHGNKLRDFLPDPFSGAWSRQSHERIISANGTHLADTATTQKAKALFSHLMNALFDVSGIDSVEVHATTDGHATLMIHAGPEQYPLLEEICGRLTVVLKTFEGINY